MTDNIYDKYDYSDDDIAVAEYVGYPLYVSLRNRLAEDLRVPIELVNPIIVEAIDVYDTSVLTTDEPPLSTIVMWDSNTPKMWVEFGDGMSGKTYGE